MFCKLVLIHNILYAVRAVSNLVKHWCNTNARDENNAIEIFLEKIKILFFRPGGLNLDRWIFIFVQIETIDLLERFINGWITGS